MIALLLTLALAGQTAPSTPCNLRVQVVDDATSKALPKIAVNLRLGLENRRTIQQETDSQGSTCFTVAALAHPVTSVDAFSIHYHSVAADPQITHLPESVTIRMRHLSWLESLRYVFQGD
jgi:hypothetical protein